MKLGTLKFYNNIILFTFLAIGASQVFSQESQDIIALVGIFSLGILHGSNDLFVMEKIKGNAQHHHVLKPLLMYIGVVLLFVVVFFLFPLLALIAFILISGYHFGEQHFHHKIDQHPSTLVSLFYLFYGLLVLFGLLVLNTDEVLFIIEDMTGFLFTSSMLWTTLIISFLGSCIVFAVLANYNTQLRQSVGINLFYLILFSVVFFFSDLIWGFATYFILWHSLPSLKDQVHSIYGNFNTTNVLNYVKKAFPYWLVSIIGMCVVVWVFKDSNYFLSLLFAFIASITFPHVFVMRTLFKTKGN
jgi:Brp/Blh family beta-carotene 15,15'-monooxygenase